MSDPTDSTAQDEVEVFLAAERRRHHRLIAGVGAGSLLLLLAGITCLLIAQDDQKVGYAAAGALMTGLGALGLVRAAVSLWTDIDTRDRGEWDLVVGNEPVQEVEEEP